MEVLVGNVFAGNDATWGLGSDGFWGLIEIFVLADEKASELAILALGA